MGVAIGHAAAVAARASASRFSRAVANSQRLACSCARWLFYICFDGLAGGAFGASRFVAHSFCTSRCNESGAYYVEKAWLKLERNME